MIPEHYHFSTRASLTRFLEDMDRRPKLPKTERLSSMAGGPPGAVHTSNYQKVVGSCGATVYVNYIVPELEEPGRAV